MNATARPVAPVTPTVETDAGRSLESLRRVRVGVSLVLTLGVAASITANVLHAQPTAVGRAIAAWPPLALLLTVELISRVPVHSRRLAALRLTATAAIAGIAAWVSYWHMVEVAHTHGETTDSAHLIPLSVDGLVVVASICLVEIGSRLRALSVGEVPALPAETAPKADQKLNEQPDDDPGHSKHKPLRQPLASDQPDHADDHVYGPKRQEPHQKQAVSRPTATALAVSRLRTRHPDWTAAQIAARLGVHASTVRRHLNAHAIASTGSRNEASATARTATSSDASSHARSQRASDNTEAA